MALTDPGARGFLTDRFELINRLGKKIVGYVDRPADNQTPQRAILITPVYGETKENNLLISSYFASNGFYSFRFDWTEHAGESDGEIFTCTLSKMKEDLLVLLDYLGDQYPLAKRGIFASSLAARVALKVASDHTPLDFLIQFAPVVNLQCTLEAVYREDLVANYLGGKRYGTLDVLGFIIDADAFLGNAVHGFSNLSSSLEDAKNVQVPTFFLVGEKDPWVQMDDSRSVFKMINTAHKRFSTIPTALHRLMENPIAAGKALKEAIAFSVCDKYERAESAVRISEPPSDQIRDRETLEKDHLRELYEFSKSDERQFWKKYLSGFQYIINIPDYWNLLELNYNLLGGAWPGQKILDAGCGNCNYGLFLLSKEMYKARQVPPLLSVPPISYFGLDFIWDAIKEGRQSIASLQNQFKTSSGIARRLPGTVEVKLTMADLEAENPFPDNFFDQICCNFVLSYVEDPTYVLKELCRVLKPGGKLIISSLKPDYDLSQVYRNFISVAENDEQVEKARKLLSNAATIRMKGLKGIYRFFTERELKQMVRREGLSRVKTFRAFGNQANLVVGQKIQRW